MSAIRDVEHAFVLKSVRLISLRTRLSCGKVGTLGEAHVSKIMHPCSAGRSLPGHVHDKRRRS